MKKINLFPKFSLDEGLHKLTDLENKETETDTISQNNQEEIIDGHGRCKSCSCSGYKPGKENSYCTCGHHYYQHEKSNWLDTLVTLECSN
ncbi:hypothetical protein [Mucilaginibacter sp.]|uniref:hypothetical protein n=1 Tax=Mucilaginibacter sp. TaxID=1882438 RepID=UPI002849B037|nr:hypothetical protein [Mucilaginibacter sp.]MDR3695781.1 hypothetical protein [Mucilaginibacter sp.]